MVGSVSLKPLGEALLQLKQMAVEQEWQRRGIGRQLAHPCGGLGRSSGFQLMVLNARIGAEGFYAAFGYLAAGEPFEENTLPHVRMTKLLA